MGRIVFSPLELCNSANKGWRGELGVSCMGVDAEPYGTGCGETGRNGLRIRFRVN